MKIVHTFDVPNGSKIIEIITVPEGIIVVFQYPNQSLHIHIWNQKEDKSYKMLMEL
jgi:hypothetical protein